MKTAATSDRFEEFEPFPTTPRTYTHDSDDNVEEFATANWREEEIYAPSRKHLICSIAGRSDTMSRSLGKLADEVRAMPDMLNQSVATLRATVEKSTPSAEENRRVVSRVQELGAEVQELGVTVGKATAALTIDVTRATHNIDEKREAASTVLRSDADSYF